MGFGEIALLLTGIAGLGGTGYSLFKVRSEKRKIGADAAQVLSQSAIGLLEPMNTQIDVLEKRLEACNAQIDTLQGKLRQAHIENDELRQQNKELQYQMRELLEELRTYRRES